jgi:hypothetical protein
MQINRPLMRPALTLVIFLSLVTTNVHAAMYSGTATGAGGVVDTPNFTGGIRVAVGDVNSALPPSSQAYEYFIPLDADHTGTYGLTPANCGASGVGTCSDSGSGQGYGNADALSMNLFFDTAAVSAGADVQLDIFFADLDLKPINDPTGFFESLTFSYWDSSDPSNSHFVNIGGVIQEAAQLTGGVFAGHATVDPDPAVDPFTWRLNLATLDMDLLDNLANGFWIQLGFGSQYLDAQGNPKRGTNTPEYLAANLTVSSVPIPTAFWLFGSALIGFIGMSRRTRI